MLLIETHEYAFNIYRFSIEIIIKLCHCGTGTPIYWLREETHNKEVMNSNPCTGYPMDIFHIAVKIVLFY